MEFRKTKQRTAIRSVFDRLHQPLSPEEVQRAAEHDCEGIGIATVYRNLKALVEEGWLVAVDFPGQPPRYERSGKEHHHHFHCNACGQVFELEVCTGDFRQMVPRGFLLTAHELLLYGLCDSCQHASVAAPVA